ncbi:MAG: hypothetical protein ACFCU4_06715 [Puniceicoccaceae bacterium]
MKEDPRDLDPGGMLGLSILGGVASLGTLATVGLFFRLPFSAELWAGYYLVGAIGGALIGRNLRSMLTVLGLHLALLLGATFLAASITDVGWDSVQTHQVGVLNLRSGWNPIHPEDQSWLEALPEEGLIRSAPRMTQEWMSLNLVYILGSFLASLPPGFEGAKGLQIILWICLFLNLRTLFTRLRVGGVTRWFATLSLSFNPVIFYQLWTLYLDLGVAVFITLALAALWTLSRRAGGLEVGIFIVSLLLLSFTKRTGLLLGAPLIGAGLVLLFLRVRPPKRYYWLTAGGFLSVVVLIGALASGALRGYQLGDLKQMVVEPASFDRERGMKVPPHLSALSRPELFLRSLAEATDVERGARLKIPLTWEGSEWTMFRVVMYPGYTSGGFGPLFSGILVIAVLISFRRKRGELDGRWVRKTAWGGLVILCLILPSSFARWVPFVWCLPLLIGFDALLERDRGVNSADRKMVCWKAGSLLHLGLALLMGGLAIANTGALATQHLTAQMEATRVIDRFLDGLEEQNEPVRIHFGRSIAVKRWLWEREIPFEYLPEVEVPFQEVPFTVARIPREGDLR